VKISIIIPAFNEENTITNTIDEVEKYLINYSQCSWWEIVIVNDGSSDNTLAILQNYQKDRDWLRVEDLVVNTGRGAALRAGIDVASGDIIVSLDADLSYAPYHIGKMVSCLVGKGADVVLASAYCKEGTVKNVPLNRLWISQLGNKVLSFMFNSNVTVLTCIVRAYRKDFIQKLDLHANNKNIHLEILYKAKIIGAKILEIPADMAWHSPKVDKDNKLVKRRSTLKLRKTSNSHFFFALLSRPGLVFIVPGFVLLLVSLSVFGLCLKSVISEVFYGASLYQATRASMINATPSWLSAMFTFVLSIQFFSLGFLTNQNKWNYEETYKTNNQILVELKKRQ